MTLKAVVKPRDMSIRAPNPIIIRNSISLSWKKGRGCLTPQAVFNDFLMALNTAMPAQISPTVAIMPAAPQPRETARIVPSTKSGDTGMKPVIASVTLAAALGSFMMRPNIEIAAKTKGKSESKR